MQKNPAKKSMLQKQIPTILGLLVLVVALIAGVFFLGEGPGVFAPRATPQTTPKKIKVTNVTDTGFTVSFITDEATAGFVKYGESASEVESQTSDDRDQLSGTIGEYQTHHITVRGLRPATTYHYVLGTGSRAEFDNNGQPFEVTTTKRAGAPSAAKTIFGTVLGQSDAPAEGAIVYVALPGVGEMSSLVKASGSFAVPLSNARTADGSSYAQISDTDTLSIVAQGANASQTTSFNILVSDAEPIGTITLGQPFDGAEAVAADTGEGLDRPTNSDGQSGNPTSGIQPLDDDARELRYTATNSGTTQQGGSNILSDFNNSRGTGGQLTGEATPSATPSPDDNKLTPVSQKQVIDLDSLEEQIISDGSPVIRGTAAPSVVISIEVNSETQIRQELIANEDGTFELDIEALKQQLEPGEHTATYSYTDPNTGELVTKTVSFVVEEPSSSSRSSTGGSQLAQANTSTGGTTSRSTSTSPSPSPTPFGSGNPVSQASPSPSSTASGSSSIGGAKGSTRSGVPATNSAVPVSGSFGVTFALLLGGFFFITAGVWSHWLAREYVGVEGE